MTNEEVARRFWDARAVRDRADCSNIANITDDAPRWWLEHIITASTGG